MGEQRTRPVPFMGINRVASVGVGWGNAFATILSTGCILLIAFLTLSCQGAGRVVPI